MNGLFELMGISALFFVSAGLLCRQQRRHRKQEPLRFEDIVQLFLLGISMAVTVWTTRELLRLVLTVLP